MKHAPQYVLISITLYRTLFFFLPGQFGADSRQPAEVCVSLCFEAAINGAGTVIINRDASNAVHQFSRSFIHVLNVGCLLFRLRLSVQNPAF